MRFIGAAIENPIFWLLAGAFLLCAVFGLVARNILSKPSESPQDEALEEVRGDVNRRLRQLSRSRRWLRYIANLLSFVQIVVGGVIAAHTFQHETTQILGASVLIATLMGLWLKPGYRLQVSDSGIVVLKAAVRRARLEELRGTDAVVLIKIFYDALDKVDILQGADPEAEVPPGQASTSEGQRPPNRPAREPETPTL